MACRKFTSGRSMKGIKSWWALSMRWWQTSSKNRAFRTLRAEEVRLIGNPIFWAWAGLNLATWTLWWTTLSLRTSRSWQAPKRRSRLPRPPFSRKTPRQRSPRRRLKKLMQHTRSPRPGRAPQHRKLRKQKGKRRLRSEDAKILTIRQG